MAITKEKLPQSNIKDSPKRVSNSPRASGVSGFIGSNAASDDSIKSRDEMGYGRIVKVIKAIQRK